MSLRRVPARTFDPWEPTRMGGRYGGISHRQERALLVTVSRSEGRGLRGGGNDDTEPHVVVPVVGVPPVAVRHPRPVSGIVETATAHHAVAAGGPLPEVGAVESSALGTPSDPSLGTGCSLFRQPPTIFPMTRSFSLAKRSCRADRRPRVVARRSSVRSLTMVSSA